MARWQVFGFQQEDEVFLTVQVIPVKVELAWLVESISTYYDEGSISGPLDLTIYVRRHYVIRDSTGYIHACQHLCTYQTVTWLDTESVQYIAS